MEKRHEIRSVEEQNANLRRDIENKKKLIHELQYSKDKQDEVVRKWLHEGKLNEIQFILPDQGKPGAPPSAHADPSPRTR